MGKSVGLAAYLAFSERALGFAERKLEVRKSRGKEDPARIGERFGKTGLARPAGTLVWFHAASVGETLSILELIKRLADLRGDLNFLITTGTVTSAALIAGRLPDRAVHQFVPVDARQPIREFLTHWQPDLAVWTESELWPALMHETHAAGVLMLLINARISRATHNKWRWFPGMAKSLLQRFDFVLAQDAQTSGFLRRLGVPKNRIEVCGTLKEGSAALPCDEAERAHFAAQLAGRPVWLAASTHPGEEEMVAKAHKQAARSAQRLLFPVTH